MSINDVNTIELLNDVDRFYRSLDDDKTKEFLQIREEFVKVRTNLLDFFVENRNIKEVWDFHSKYKDILFYI